MAPARQNKLEEWEVYCMEIYCPYQQGVGCKSLVNTKIEKHQKLLKDQENPGHGIKKYFNIVYVSSTVENLGLGIKMLHCDVAAMPQGNITHASLDWSSPSF